MIANMLKFAHGMAHNSTSFGGVGFSGVFVYAQTRDYAAAGYSGAFDTTKPDTEPFDRGRGKAWRRDENDVGIYEHAIGSGTPTHVHH